jgi:hypothetical protein
MTKKELVAQLAGLLDEARVEVVCQVCGRAVEVHYIKSRFNGGSIVIHTTINSPGETWKNIPGWYGKYQVSDLGNVRNTKGEFLSQRLNRGWKLVSLRKNGNRFERRVHKLVAETFIRPFLEKENTHHINGIRHDNRLINLEILPISDHTKLHTDARGLERW